MHDQKDYLKPIIISATTTIAIILITLGTIIAHREKVASFFVGTDALISNSPQAIPGSVVGNASIVSAVRKANPAVVSIIITKDAPIIERYFDDFFGFQIPRYRQNGTERQEVGGGSGFLVSAEGLIVTNQHVVSDTNAEYTVYTNDGKKHPARVIAKDSGLDIALIKIEGTAFPFLTFAQSSSVELGETVVAIGNALGEFRNTVSVGVISGLSRSIQAGSGRGEVEELDEVIQTDAAINPGNSGGPLLNLDGNVIGVNVAVAEGSQSIGFALPADAVKVAVESVKTRGIISRPFLGIRYIPVTDPVKIENKLSVDYGVLVTQGSGNNVAVLPNSPAAKAGIVEGDVILEFAGTKLTIDKKLASLIRTKNVGDTVTLKILHQGQEKTIQIVLEEAPSN
ncbi:MAG: trypsin-like peptidase domain-containing protein [bacterium]|nr:trypsin-like peptidase domain-containing protein [bacterium]